jgi:two-component system, cell cycle response regulator DivK
MSKTVLLVEDDADARTIYQDALAKRGYEVITALHGAEGVHLARRVNPDLVLMDIRMPIMDGWQAIRYLKTDPATSHVPVWAISAYLAEEVPRGPSEGVRFDRMLPKPIDPRNVVAEIEAHIGPPEGRWTS